MSQPVIRVENLSKRYLLGGTAPHPSLKDELGGWLRRHWRRWWRGAVPVAAPSHEVWALRDISFELEAGVAFGIIGNNGSGKSTLLKVLSRITAPTTGRAEIRGRVGSLLEVGTGFHPHLTGRENIFLNGAILGLARREIARHFDEIVEFAEIGQFLDEPVKHYSSGMYMRLAFAVAAHLLPEVLFLDEVLAVGDEAFQQKCLDKMRQIARSGRTVLFVSHNMAAVNQLCKRVLKLEKGRMELMSAEQAATTSTIRVESPDATGLVTWPHGTTGDEAARELAILGVAIRDRMGRPTSVVDFRVPFSIDVVYRVNERLPRCRIGFVFTAAHGHHTIESYDVWDADHNAAKAPGIYVARCRVPGDLRDGSYALSVCADDVCGGRYFAILKRIMALVILDKSTTSRPTRWGDCQSLLDWSTASCASLQAWQATFPAAPMEQAA